MAKYNAGFKYNHTSATSGALYNSAHFVFMVRLFEVIHTSETVSNIVVKNILNERMGVFDVAVQYALNSISDTFDIKDNSKASALMQLAEKIKIKDTLSNVIVFLYLKDKAKLLSEIRNLDALIAKEEKINFDEISNVEALIEKAEKAGFKDFAKLLANIKQFEYTKVTDKKPRKAITDFMIGNSDELDQSVEWFLPLEMMIDFGKSSIQVMPQAESTYIEMPYADGSLRENTVYKNRMFNLMLWSKDGLNTFQKESLKAKITQILDSTKKETKKFTIQKTGTTFDAFYAGEPDIQDAPTFVKAMLPFEVSPYGYPLFEQEVFGTGLLVNRGDKEGAIINVIAGGCEYPAFQIGSVSYKWNGVVPINAKLVIEHSSMTCYLENTDGEKENALDRLTGEFQSLPSKTTIQITAFDNTEDYLKTTVKELVLWMMD